MAKETVVMNKENNATFVIKRVIRDYELCEDNIERGRVQYQNHMYRVQYDNNVRVWRMSNIECQLSSGNTIIVRPTVRKQENTTENAKTVSKSNDHMYPAIVTIGGEEHGKVVPNPEYSELRYFDNNSAVEIGDYVFTPIWDEGYIVGIDESLVAIQVTQTGSVITCDVMQVFLAKDQTYSYTQTQDSVDRANYLDLLEGQEVLSLEYAGVIAVKNGTIWQLGECINPSPSTEDLHKLFKELIVNEFGG